MKAKEYAQYIFSLMEKAGYPYMSPELDDEDIYGVPPTIKVWDADQSMIRVIAFADDKEGAIEALRWARDYIPTLENTEYYWPEAWWRVEPSDKLRRHHGIVEGWDDPIVET